jgi:multiple sugar transport system substrate-binding protein
MPITKSFSRVSMLIIAALLSCSCEKPRDAALSDTPKHATFEFSRKPVSDITFLSTQLNPVGEAGKMRNAILKDFPGKVDFRPNDNSYFFDQIDAILKSEPGKSILLGGTHGDLVGLFEKGTLRAVDDVLASLEKKEFSESLLALCRLDGQNSYYVPWMQASFVMVANKKALPYLPEGADLRTLSYEQLRQWGKIITERTGKAALGFPAGKNGLLHRFFQGYLYPSFTASTLVKFRSREAKPMWAYFKDLWRYVNPGSLSYSSMSEPLITEDVWIAWDHSARLIKAFKERPDDFVAFPAPIGPRGRGYMIVISGLGIPRASVGTESQAALIDYLTRPAIQLRTLSETGFFPVVAYEANAADLPRHLKALSSALNEQADSRYAIPTLLPIGLAERGGDYNSIFTLTFSEIVLEGKDPDKVLNENAAALQEIINHAHARCWLPDVSEARPCKLE